jgi:cytochrome c nitrite reductase small subunit
MPDATPPSTRSDRGNSPKRRRWVTFVALAAIGIAVGAAANTFRYAEGWAYLSNDPKACVNCHVMREQYEGWQSASHHHVATCNDCHVPQGFPWKWVAKADAGYRHSKAFTLQDWQEPIRMIPRSRANVLANCVRCHADLTDQIGAHGDAAHSEPADCIRCHADVGHGPPR